jgi:cytochrome c oxidase subunit II
LAEASVPRRQGLGPWFWTVTSAMTVLNIVVGIFIVVFPLGTLLPEAADPAGQIDDLFKFMSVIGNAFFVYVTGYLIYFSIVWRRRASDGPDAIGIQIHDNPKLETWWTIIPVILVATIAVFSVRIWMELQNQLGDVLTMEAVGQQFKYEFRYPKLKESVYDEMHVPVGTPVTLHVTSIDVIHSFWVPEVRLKADMVPGLVQTLRFTPEVIGKYPIICTEFCGTNHSTMRATLYIDSQKDFGNWLAARFKEQGQGGGTIALAQGVADNGRVLFGQKCSTCHSLGPFAQKIVGPGLGNLAHDPDHATLVDGKAPTPQNVAEILVNGFSGPIGVMPNRHANALSNSDISNLVAYLLSLHGK